MSRIKVILLSLLAVFAFTAVMASVAQAKAVEGPFYKIEAVRLASGHTAEIAAEANGAQVLKAGTDTVSCTTVKLKSGALLEGLPLEEFSRSKEVVEYSGCSVGGNGTPCSVTEPIKTEPVVNKTAFEKENAVTKEGEGGLLTVFEPETGKVFVTIHFTGTGCAVKSTAVEEGRGKKGVIARNLNGKKEAVKVGEHEEEAVTNELEFPATPITTAFVEESKVLKKVEAELLAFGASATLEGKIKLKLTKTTGSKVWGVFSK